MKEKYVMCLRVRTVQKSQLYSYENIQSSSVFNLYYVVIIQVTSQNPYVEVFVGKPFVQTVDINNVTEVEVALQEIIKTKV